MDELKPEILEQICVVEMPFGKYKGTVLVDLPISYLEWFHRNGGFPKGKLGMQLSTIYEIKINGLMDLLSPLLKKSSANTKFRKTNYRF